MAYKTPVNYTDLIFSGTPLSGVTNPISNVAGIVGLKISATVGNSLLVLGDGLFASGSSGGGAVSSVFTRTGAVVATSGDYNTLQVTENTNLYFTNARAIASTLTGYAAAAGVISSADSVLSALQKVDGNDRQKTSIGLSLMLSIINYQL